MWENNYHTIDKSYSYLTWRYIQNPSKNYLFYEIRNKNIFGGYIVIKKLRFKLQVVDIIPVELSTGTMRNIHKAINNIALQYGKPITAYSILNNNFWLHVFDGATYFSKSTKNNEFYLTIKLHKKNLDKEILDPNKWICFTGDIL